MGRGLRLDIVGTQDAVGWVHVTPLLSTEAKHKPLVQILPGQSW